MWNNISGCSSDHEEELAPPPPVATRPERTKSIYTKPVEETKTTLNGLANLDKNKNHSPNNTNNTVQSRAASDNKQRKKISDEEILDRLRTIVSVGDPNRKYTKMEKIGQG